MQINFFMNKDDQREFHEYLFSRGGYLTPGEWPSKDIPILRSVDDEKIPAQKYPLCSRDLKLFREDVFPSFSLQDYEWFTKQSKHELFSVWGPGIEYLTAWQDEEGIRPGRLYMGAFSAGSFQKPGEPYGGAYEKYGDGVRQMTNFYNSCCRYIRKRCRKAESGFWHGPGCDKEEEAGIVLLSHHYA